MLGTNDAKDPLVYDFLSIRSAPVNPNSNPSPAPALNFFKTGAMEVQTTGTTTADQALQISLLAETAHLLKTTSQ
jgi:hypothetical protein